MLKISALFSLIVIIICLNISSYSQTPGVIVRPSGGGIVTKLNPNGDSWSSASTSGYVSNDIAESEIPFKIIPATFYEPTGDLNRGPSGGFSDLVKDVDGSGFYSYFDGTNLYFRLRIGSIVSGAKGYSVMIDADAKFGNSGNNPDPNYIANTSGSNGNPGFEWEVVLETNSRVAIYSVDGTSDPAFIASFPLSTNHQISIANSFASSNPDYFYDFYVPISAFTGNPNTITANTALRMVATTVMAPKPAIGGPVSDIFGINGYVDPNIAFTDIIQYQPAVTPDNIQKATSIIGSVMTAAPTLTTPVSTGSTVTVSGTWTRLDTTKSSNSLIKLYKNGTLAGTIDATSGAGWSISSINVSQNDVFYVTAQGKNEALSPQSNTYKVLGYTTSNTTSNAGLSFSCISNRGMQGNKPTNVSVKVYKITATSAPVLYADDTNFIYKVTYGSTTTWRYDSLYTQSSSACTGGQADISLGQYAITATQAGYCESAPIFTGGCSLVATTTAPVITQTALYEGNTIVSGTATAGTTVKLYKNGLLDTAVKLASGVTAYSFTNRAMYKNDTIEVRCQLAGQCESAGTKRTVLKITSTPFINTSTSGTLISGSTTISGKSSEPAGTVVTIYESGVLKGTTTVLADGTWSVTYTVLSGRTYYAMQQKTGFDVSGQTPVYSVQSATIAVPTITGLYTEDANTVAVSVPAGFAGKLFLYEDGQKIDSLTVTSSASASTVNIPVNTTITNKLYAGGSLTATAQATGNAENANTSNVITVTCAIPAVPTISPVSSTIYNGEKVIYAITAAQSEMLFTLRDSADQKNLSTSAFGTGSDVNIASVPFTTNGIIPVRLKSTSFSGPGCESYVKATVTVIPASSPSVVTTNASSVSVDSATLGGNVTAANGPSVTERGIVYNTTGMPTVSDNKVIIGSGIGVFSQSITGLSSLTTYYVRAYAINSVGISYGTEINFTTTVLAPSTPMVSDNTVSGFTLSWDAVSGATSYRLDIATDNTFTTFVTGYNDFTVTGTSAVVSELASGTTYYFRLRAFNSGGESASSEIGSTLTTASSNANLSELAISEGKLSPDFSANTTSYTASVENSVTSLTITPSANATAIVAVNGTTVSSGSASEAIALSVGKNTIKVVVTAQDGSKKTYTIAATRAIQIPSEPNLTKSSDIGISNYDNITSVTTPDFVGTADSGATVIIYDDNTQIGLGVGDSSGNWKITSSVLDNGLHLIRSEALLNGITSSISKGLYVTIDNIAPIVSSISRLNPDSATTDATMVTYRITFSETISAMTANALKLTLSGTVTGTIASVTSDTGTIIDVTINNISGEGDLRLEVGDNTPIMDVAGNLMSAGFAEGQVYTIVDGSTLPITLVAFNAYRKESTVEVTWKAVGETNVDKYVIERSNAATTYTEVGEMIAKGNSSTDVVYSWTDNQPLSGNNFYRLKTIDKDGTVKYSDIKTINFSLSGQYLKIVPNPVVDKTIRYTLGNVAAGKYQVCLYDNNGASVFSTVIVHDGRNAIKTIRLTGLSASGMYHLSFAIGTCKLNEAVMIK